MMFFLIFNILHDCRSVAFVEMRCSAVLLEKEGE